MSMTPYSLRRGAWLAALLLALGATARADDYADPAKEKSLIATLKSGEPAAKAIACKELTIYGSADCVPELAQLLADEQLASWARIALEAIPDPAADKALREATDKLQGKLLVGAINSIGVRRDAGAAERLIGRLQDQDEQVAAAAALALGRIGNEPATDALRKALHTTKGEVRNTVAEGCILCAERLMNEGQSGKAIEIYDEVRGSEAPKQRVLEATRGAILARKTDGIPLLIEQLHSPDKGRLQIGLSTARELPGHEVAEALGAELAKAAPDRAVMLLYALADRADSTVTPAVLAAAKSGATPVRVAAIRVIGKSGNASHLPALLEIATADDAELAAMAKESLAGLGGDDVDAEISSRLGQSSGKTLLVLIEAVGRRRIPATAALVESLKHDDAAVRRAALASLGETVGPRELSVLIAAVVAPQHDVDAEAAERALRAACQRMPDRDACAEELTAAMQAAPPATKVKLVAILGAMGGGGALRSIAATMKGNDEALQDAGSRALGEWMSVDAAPVLLDLAKTSPSDKLRVRALRGYLRLARQFKMSDDERAAMCQQALDAAERSEEQALALAVLERYANPASLRVALAASEKPELRDDALRVATAIVGKLGDSSAIPTDLLDQIGLRAAKIEIVKAEYGAGASKKDVTDVLRRQVHDLRLVSLPSANYNESFGGDPAPNVKKTLTVQYQIDGKPGEATFDENATVLLPMPE